jgi:hypothetical protein
MLPQVFTHSTTPSDRNYEWNFRANLSKIERQGEIDIDKAG